LTAPIKYFPSIGDQSRIDACFAGGSLGWGEPRGSGRKYGDR
jgi:hypothetical protein